MICLQAGSVRIVMRNWYGGYINYEKNNDYVGNLGLVYLVRKIRSYFLGKKMEQVVLKVID